MLPTKIDRLFQLQKLALKCNQKQKPIFFSVFHKKNFAHRNETFWNSTLLLFAT